VRHWVHNGFLSIDSAKMSKSLGNFFSVRELLDDAPGEAIRLALLSAHYRDPLDWTSERLRQARANLDRFYRALTLSRDPVFERFGEADEAVRPVKDALEDDLNTPLALTRLHELVGAINRTSSDAVRSALQRALEQGGRLMGLLEQDRSAGCAAASRPTNSGSRSISRCGRRRAGNVASPKPTKSERHSPPRGFCSKTVPTAPPLGGARTDAKESGPVAEDLEGSCTKSKCCYCERSEAISCERARYLRDCFVACGSSQ